MEAALRLDPRGPQLGAFWTTAGFARLLLGDRAEAVVCFLRGREANPKLPRAHFGAAVALAITDDVPAAKVAAGELLKLVPQYRLSQTIDCCQPLSPPRYRQFYDDVLRPGAIVAGVPV